MNETGAAAAVLYWEAEARKLEFWHPHLVLVMGLIFVGGGLLGPASFIVAPPMTAHPEQERSALWVPGLGQTPPSLLYNSGWPVPSQAFFATLPPHFLGLTAEGWLGNSGSFPS